MKVTIIGMDCATDKKNVGLAFGQMEGKDAWIEEVTLGSRVPSVAETIARWAKRSSCTLLALDAPLGWPVDLGGTLITHKAGEPIDVCRKDLFRRETDRFVYCKVHKWPFAVGADKIAHTAHSALERLEKVRKLTGQPIPLAWDPKLGPRIQAIEVYPGATLKACWAEAPTYKGKDKQAERREVLDFLGERVRLPEDTALMEDNDDALDAGLCVLAGLDFLQGRAMEPEDLQKARKEGWIWVREPVK